MTLGDMMDEEEEEDDEEEEDIDEEMDEKDLRAALQAKAVKRAQLTNGKSKILRIFHKDLKKKF